MNHLTKKTLLTQTAGALLIISFASASFAGCKRPAEPSFPDVDLASQGEIQQASADVNSYLSKADKYLRCEKNSSRHTIAMRNMRKVVKNYNTLIEDYKLILAEYNESNKTASITASYSNQQKL